MKKCISVIQPWAGLLVLGIKEFETRSWITKHRGELLIHASAKIPPEGKAILEWLAKTLPGFKLGEHNHQICTTTGAILGKVEIERIFKSNDLGMVCSLSDLERSLGNYEPDRYFWECSNPELFQSPIQFKGQLSIYNVDI